jgi:4,5-dihydroxyphthalate decarboxylase
VFRLFKEARAADAASKGPLDPYRFGVAPNRASLERIIDYSYRQQLIPRKFSLDELFDDLTRSLA